MLLPEHVDRLCRLGNGKRSVVAGRRRIMVQFEEGSELLVGHGEVMLVFVEAPCNLCVEVGYEEVWPWGSGRDVSQLSGE